MTALDVLAWIGAVCIGPSILLAIHFTFDALRKRWGNRRAQRELREL